MQTPSLERALAIVSGAKIEHRETGGVVVYLDDSNDANLIPKIVEMYGYQPDPTEVASSNVLHFVEVADFDEDEDDEESIDDESIDDDSDGEDEEDGDDEETEGKSGGEGLNNLDDDGRSLKVLASPESHRFAAKIFQDMLGNDNMAGYAAFLQDFDRFLVQHKGRGDIAFGGKRKKDSEISSEEDDFFEVAFDLIETAKKKKEGRAGLLSALMKAISGDAGDAIVKAWDAGDAEKLKELLGSATEKVASNLGKAKD